MRVLFQVDEKPDPEKCGPWCHSLFSFNFIPSTNKLVSNSIQVRFPLVMLLQARIAGFIFRTRHLDWTPWLLSPLSEAAPREGASACCTATSPHNTWATLHLCEGKNNRGPLGVLFHGPLSFSFILGGIIMLTQLSLHLMLSSSVGEDCRPKSIEVPAYGRKPILWEFLKGICKW